ncbi:MAG: DUF4180 domain-containing protein, partial [Bacteroidota bacterium]
CMPYFCGAGFAMEIKTHTINEHSIAEVVSDQIVFRTTQEAVEVMMNCYYNGASKMIVYEQHLPAEFFDLKTGFAGDVLQKFSTYQIQLAIVGDFTKYTSKSLKDFIYESNQMKRINFVGSLEEALDRLK